MPPNRVDIVAALAADLASPRIVAAIDSVMSDLANLRRVAVGLHGEPGATPQSEVVTPQPQKTAEPTTDTRGTLMGLIQLYKTDERSQYHQLRFKTRENYNSLMNRLIDDYGTDKLSEIKAKEIQAYHDGWSFGGKTAIAHSLITMLRGLVSFGANVLEDADCERLAMTLHGLRFKVEKSSNEPLTEAHVLAIINKATESGLSSIALAQALQFEGQLRQKDVIGEWIPVEERGVSDVTWRGMKWLRGIRWNEIDDEFKLRHVTSTAQKEVVLDLKKMPLVFAALKDRYGLFNNGTFNRAELPGTGPIIVYEKTGKPFLNYQFRRLWRKLADAVRVPKNIKNMDSRVGERERAAERTRSAART